MKHNEKTTRHSLGLISELLARATKSEEQSETQYHYLSDEVKRQGRVVPLTAQVGGVEKRPETSKKKEDEEERAWWFH
jgi:3,4-dihydroxy-2-butanone 4-phosphate synthase